MTIDVSWDVPLESVFFPGIFFFSRWSQAGFTAPSYFSHSPTPQALWPFCREFCSLNAHLQASPPLPFSVFFQEQNPLKESELHASLPKTPPFSSLGNLLQNFFSTPPPFGTLSTIFLDGAGVAQARITFPLLVFPSPSPSQPYNRSKRIVVP